VTRRRRNRTSQQGLKTSEKNIRGNLRGIQELSREAELSAVDRTSSRGITVLPGRGADAQQNPGKVREPVGRSQAGAQGVLQPTVKAFNQTISLGMIGCSRGKAEVEEAGEAGPNL